MLNKEFGMFGVFGILSDFCDLEDEVVKGNDCVEFVF